MNLQLLARPDTLVLWHQLPKKDLLKLQCLSHTCAKTAAVYFHRRWQTHTVATKNWRIYLHRLPQFHRGGDERDGDRDGEKAREDKKLYENGEIQGKLMKKKKKEEFGFDR